MLHSVWIDHDNVVMIALLSNVQTLMSNQPTRGYQPYIVQRGTQAITNNKADTWSSNLTWAWVSYFQVHHQHPLQIAAQLAVINMFICLYS